jgi:glycosyltransferase involved in cell wall biosynthesis
MFIVKELAPRMLDEGVPAKISIFGHRIPAGLTLPENIVHHGFVENLQGKQKGSLGVIVPFHGGAGMQSKIFEPMILGVPIIANPKNFAGFDFKPFEHYYPATTQKEYLEAIKFFLNHPHQVLEMSIRAQEKSSQMFSRNKIVEVIEELILNR